MALITIAMEPGEYWQFRALEARASLQLAGLQETRAQLTACVAALQAKYPAADFAATGQFDDRACSLTCPARAEAPCP